MTDTITIKQPGKRPMANDRLASFLLLLGLVIVPVFFGIFGILYGAPVRTQNIWAGCLLLVFLVLGFYACIASAFFTSYTLSRRFLLALVAFGLFAIDFYISLVSAVLIFDFD